LDKERRIIQCHHERWDGKGYPLGIAGNEIPYLARILAVADSFDAMTNNRPYRPAMQIEQAVEELIKNKNTQFDGEIVDTFVKIL
jgi:HD-GYP domain-containing protein (c-di-GMP phosphodiesterase class II)